LLLYPSTARQLTGIRDLMIWVTRHNKHGAVAVC